ncbi:MAG: ABC transporter permease subunit [Anaerolineales bacterium]|nr:ABC transporter permease subunit [Anaerolineales bacterium]MDW8162751.1 ABC transporter permease subunit [Anaerolineales bacterium]
MESKSGVGVKTLQDTRQAEKGALEVRPSRAGSDWIAWLGLLPFFLFAVMFLFLPSLSIFVRSFQDRGGNFTFENIIALFTVKDIINAYRMSLTISLITAVGGGIFGFLLAYAVIMGGLPRVLRSFLLTFSGVASNFAGVPLAFAFVATMGNAGLVTRLIEQIFNINTREMGFSIYNIYGLSIVYMYFQFPLMVLIMAPALDGLRREWREACENLGGTEIHYWRYIALPILLPTILGAMILLFGNAFGAYATAYAFSGSFINLVTILIGAQIQGDVLYNPGLGNALALGMIVIMSLTMVGYVSLQRRASRWLR